MIIFYFFLKKYNYGARDPTGLPAQKCAFYYLQHEINHAPCWLGTAIDYIMECKAIPVPIQLLV
jgi:hypothetical protein